MIILCYSLILLYSNNFICKHSFCRRQFCGDWYASRFSDDDTNNAIVSWIPESMQFVPAWTHRYNITLNGVLIIQFNARCNWFRSGLWDREKYDFNRRDKKLILLKNLNIDDIPITDKISITITEKNNNEKKRFFHVDYVEDTIYRMLKYTLMKLSTM